MVTSKPCSFFLDIYLVCYVCYKISLLLQFVTDILCVIIYEHQRQIWLLYYIFQMMLLTFRVKCDSWLFWFNKMLRHTSETNESLGLCAEGWGSVVCIK